ncbi:DUF6571 family protein [Streptomyces sp. NPDC055952]|uniref:DUF6571 family protein n=1 Tax=Streptomyces sp. NPDC055952 TaxID=3345663 RepID=UPI0035DB158A
MLDYQTLLAADFSALSNAVDKWRKLPGEFRKMHTQYGNTVQKELEGSNWQGAGAEAALDKVEIVGKQLTAAADEAGDIHKLLDDAHEIFSRSQAKLRALKRDIESDDYVSINANGDVYLDPPKGTPSEHIGALNKSYQDTLRSYRESIRSAIEAAQEADDALSWALSQDVNGRGKGFNSNSYGSIVGAKKGRDKADKDLKELEQLTGDRSKLALAGADEPLDLASLRRMNQLLARHEGDPYFAERFATRLGAAGTLELWTRIADRVQTGDAHTKASAAIQKSLSYTLATASHSDSKAINKWKRDVITLGGEQVKYLDMKRGVIQDGPYGFQVMSSLMRYGSYDTDFLNAYGEKLIGYEKEHKDQKPNELWRADCNPDPFLNFGSGNDHGLDPMAGYMEALGHNPDAAKNLFYSEKWQEESKKDADLSFLLRREWPDGDSLGGNGRGKGFDELGHALEAAALGVPYDASNGFIQRDAQTANIMSQVVVAASEDREFVDKYPGIGDSLARMGAGYMDDLNWAISDEGGRGSVTNSDQLYKNDGAGHIGLRQATARDFLYNVGQHEGGYTILSAAQQAFTLGALEAHHRDPESAGRILGNGGYVHGVLDEARISQVDKQYGDQTDEMNQKLAESAEWKKYGVSQGIGVATGLLLLPVGGPAVSAAAAFAVPTLVEGAGAAVETQWGIEIDRETKEKEVDLSDKNRMTATRFSDLGQLRAVTPALVYMQQHDGRDHTEAVLNAYDRGANVTDRTDGGRS